MSYIDSSIACIVAREFLEGTMFVTSHFGAVLKSEKLEQQDKVEYYKRLTIFSAGGLLCGLAVSLGVGFGLKSAFESGRGFEAEVGMEAGEGVSKLIGAILVCKMMFKMPKWFGISNYGRVENQDYVVPNTLAPSDSLDSKEQMGFNLFWNIFREMAECGCFVAIEGFLNPKAYHSLGWSVMVGLAAAFATFVIIGLSMKYSQGNTPGIVCSIIVQMLAVGLFTGAAHAFEEVNEMKYGKETGYVWGGEDVDPEVNDVVKVFRFFGLRGKFSEVEFGVWMGSILGLTFLQVWHNVYGRSFNICATQQSGDSELEMQEGQDDQIAKETA